MLRTLPLVAALCLSLSLAAQPAREALLRDVRFDDEDVRPKFGTLTAAQLQEQLQLALVPLEMADQMVPTLVVKLPAIDNTTYASVEFEEPAVRDARGAAVATEPQSGMLDRYSFSVQRRLLAPGGEKPAHFATVKGRAIVRYPLSLTTKTILSSDRSAMKKLGASIDGPFVRYRRDGVGEAAWSSDVDAVRAWDAGGKRLERGGTYPDEVNGDGFEMVAFHGAPVKVEIDVPGPTVRVALDYDLTFANAKPAKVTKAMLPAEESEEGEEATDEPDAETPGTAASGNADDLLAAAVNGEVKAVRALLASGLDVNARGSSGMTALHVATAVARTAVVDVLLEAGADVNAPDSNGLTALFGLAARCDQSGTIAKLIARGADVNARGNSPTTPLALAKAMNCSETIAVLKKAGAR